jgi:hypothetical protein
VEQCGRLWLVSVASSNYKSIGPELDAHVQCMFWLTIAWSLPHRGHATTRVLVTDPANGRTSANSILRGCNSWTVRDRKTALEHVEVRIKRWRRSVSMPMERRQRGPSLTGHLHSASPAARCVIPAPMSTPASLWRRFL